MAAQLGAKASAASKCRAPRPAWRSAHGAKARGHHWSLGFLPTRRPAWRQAARGCKADRFQGPRAKTGLSRRDGARLWGAPFYPLRRGSASRRRGVRSPVSGGNKERCERAETCVCAAALPKPSTGSTPEIAEVSHSSWLPATKIHRRSTFWNLTSLSSRRWSRLSGDKARTYVPEGAQGTGERASQGH